MSEQSLPGLIEEFERNIKSILAGEKVERKKRDKGVPHDCIKYNDWCFRCEIGRDEQRGGDGYRENPERQSRIAYYEDPDNE